MKKLLTLSLLVLGLSAQAQTTTNSLGVNTNLFAIIGPGITDWKPTDMTFTMGGRTWPITAQLSNVIDWNLKTQNKSLGLTGAAKLDWKDFVGWGFVWGAIQQLPAYQTDLQNKAAAVQLRQDFPSFTFEKQSNIWWAAYGLVLTNTP